MQLPRQHNCLIRPRPRSRETRAAAAKLVRLLASDHDGEVLGAVRALKSTLLAAELDLHDLANIVEFSPHRGMLAASPREMIKCCRMCPELLTSKELAFVHSMARWHGTPTQRQLTWLCALYGRCLATERAP